MRLSEFRELMVATLGPHRAVSVADDHVFGVLGNRTANQAIRDGEDPRAAWRAVCADFDIPEPYHHGMPD